MKYILILTLLNIFSLTQLTASEQQSKNICNTRCSTEYGKCVNNCQNNDKCIEACSVKVKECRTKCK